MPIAAPRLTGTLSTLQAGRGVAALLVVLCHASIIFADVHYWNVRIYRGVFNFGYAGVEFFFVLSGFIMIHVHHRDVGKIGLLRSYLRKRFVRIYPVYWAATAIVLAIYFVTHKLHAFDPLGTLLLIGRRTDALIPVSWTLFHEIIFYLIFASLFIGRTWGTAFLLLWFAVSSFWFDRVPPHYALAPINLLFGFGIAAWFVSRHVPYPRLVLAGAVGVFFALGWEADYRTILSIDQREIAFGLAAGIGVAAAVAAERRGRLTAPTWLVRLGDASYSLYLIHFTLLFVIARLWSASPLRAIPADLAFVLVVATCVAAGLVFHRTIERPLMRRLRGFVRARRPA